MKKPHQFILVGFFALATAYFASAGFIIRSVAVHRLEINGLSVAETDAGLRLSALTSPRWDVSAPYVISECGRFCAYDLEGKSRAVTLLKSKGPATEWVFEIERQIVRDGNGKNAERRGDSEWSKEGIIFRMKAANGPYAGWYLGKDTEAPTDKLNQPTILVRDRKDASLLFFVEKEHEIGHK